MGDIFLGWDVGAWNCDRNRNSRDTLCALELRESQLFVVGRPRRSNFRGVLVAHNGDALVDALLEQIEVATDVSRHITIAIDTPLAWPRPMLELVTSGAFLSVPPEADKNPYLFRTQELALFTSGHRPLSMVRDMIGSQSTKGIHFLRRARLPAAAIGVWSRGSTVAIETYPAAAVQDGEVDRLTTQLFNGVLDRENQQRGAAWKRDVRDAIACAVVAWIHRHHPERLIAPGKAAEVAEGWIWLPASAAALRQGAQ